MEQEHRILINNNMSFLMDVTNDIESVVDLLLEKNVINRWMNDYILDPYDEPNKALRLYQVIQGRGPKAFSALCKALKDTCNIKARNILKLSITQIENKDDLLNTTLSNINLNNENSVQHAEPYVKIHPDRRRMDVNEENVPIGVYSMGSNPKGHALILNMNKVKYKDDRTGSNVDVENLNKLFIGLGFVVQIELDLTEKEIRKIIEEFIIKFQNGKKTDSIVVFIMSHGEAGNDSTRSCDILTADGININTDWIIEQFEPHKIFRSIPKLFFIQACRGENRDFGWKSFDVENNKLQNDSTSNSFGTIINRRYENVFIAHATVPGYNAKRDTVDGSWFVQKLCEVIRENAWNYDLHTMLKMVDNEIKKLNCIENGFQTVEWTYRGFNKKFYFNPGLYDDNSDHDNKKTESPQQLHTENLK